ncbi:hypothetical protein GE061_020157 [Apolygus lucorum]|uniref:Uncharacterized protein n=1 Tax=Apolygus lucorum TaxID=248454 RepID=A0A8S9WJI8_APOLU|nr:hypothetical protein GE061_020157 [Apolygus lucorum]
MSGEDEMQVGKLSVKELMQRMSEMIDSKDLATKADLKELSKEVSGLKTGQEVLKGKVDELALKNAAMEAKITRLEDLTKKSNLLFKNIANQTDVDPRQVVYAFCREVLQVEDNNLSIVYARFLKKESEYNLILAEFADSRDVAGILKRTSRLKGTGYSIQRDYSEETRKMRGKFFSMKDIIRRSHPDLKIDVRPGSLWIGKSQFFWDPESSELVGRKPGSTEAAKWNELLKKAGGIRADKKTSTRNRSPMDGVD